MLKIINGGGDVIMYSILIKTGEKSYSYYMNPDGTQYKGDTETTKEKIQELLGTYSLGKLEVVHNVTLTSEFTLEDVA